MMISPESFYEMELKGKTVPELRATLFRLRTEIGKMHSIMEGKCPTDEMIDPSPLVRLLCIREYFAVTVRALKEQGFIYKPTSQEKRTSELYAAMDDVKSIDFQIRGFHSGYRTATLSIHPETKIITLNGVEQSEDDSDNIMYLLQQLYLPEWKREYTDPSILDGIQWKLIVTFHGEVKPFAVSGSNAYPHNFDELLEIMGIDKKAIA